MTMPRVETFRESSQLPDAWDAAAPHAFLRSAALSVMERANPCRQAYHLVVGGTDVSLAASYRRRINLLACVRGWLPVPATVIAVPCSIGKPGYLLGRATGPILLDHIAGLPGLKLLLNGACSDVLPGFAAGRTLSAWRLEVTWATFAEYIAAMRSHYRRRLRQAMERWQEVESRSLEPSCFDAKWYDLYEQVHRRSAFKIEKLRIDFFREFPAQIDVFEHGSRCLGFVQTARDGDELAFMFGGMNYALARRYDTYWNLLLHVVGKGIREQCRAIDLGQTADVSKSRLGARADPRAFHAAHAFPWFHAAIRRSAGFLGFDDRNNTGRAHVFS